MRDSISGVIRGEEAGGNRNGHGVNPVTIARQGHDHISMFFVPSFQTTLTEPQVATNFGRRPS